MSNAKSTIVTIQGLNNCNAYGLAGSHFSIKYFLPVFDPSIDDSTHSSTQALTSGTGQDVQVLSATMSVSDTEFTFQGERLFNANSSIVQTAAGVGTASEVYTLSESDQYIITSAFGVSGGAGHTGEAEVTLGPSGSIINSSQNVPGRINLVGNATSAISVAFSATDNFTVSGAGAFSGDVSAVPQYPEPTYSHRNMLYPVKSFAPVDLSANTPTVDAGRYHVTLEANVGSFKFNKIVFFLAKMNADGSEDTSVLPTIFGETVFEGTQIKTKDQNQTGGTNLVWDGVIDLIFERADINDNLTYLQWDNWSFLSSAFGLATGNKVSIFDSSGSPSSWEPHARLHITDSSVDQLRLANNANNYSTMNVTSGGELNISATSVVIPQPGADSASLPTPDATAVGSNPFILSANAAQQLNLWPSSFYSYAISASPGISLELKAEKLYFTPTVSTEISGTTNINGVVTVTDEMNVTSGIKIGDSGYSTMNVTSGGELNISATSDNININTNLKIITNDYFATAENYDLSVEKYSSTSYESTQIQLLKSNTDIKNSLVTTVSGDNLGYIQWKGVDTSNTVSLPAARIFAIQAGAASSTWIPGTLELNSFGDSGGLPSTRLRLIRDEEIDIVQEDSNAIFSIKNFSGLGTESPVLKFLRSSSNTVDVLTQTVNGVLGTISFLGVTSGGTTNGPFIVATQTGTSALIQADITIRVFDGLSGQFDFDFIGARQTINSQLPTTSAGLSSNDWWNDSGTVKIVL